MARRSRARILAEIDRLDEILRFGISDWPAEAREVVPSVQEAHAVIARSAATPGQMLAGWRQAVNDIALGLKDGLRHGDPQAQHMIDTWYRRTGRDLLTDIGDPIKRAAAIAKHGHISNDTDWYLVKELILADDTSLPADVMARLGALHAAYETAKGTQ